MSRIIVKNIPKYMDANRLKTIFEKYGDVTDVKIVAREGKSRKFCFIGYKDETAGQKAKDFFNNTFIDTSRVSVDMAKTADDPDLPRPWSRYSKGSSAYNLIHGVKQTEKERLKEEKAKEEAKNKMVEDKKKKFLEFLNIMKGTNQLWNDDVTRVIPKEGEDKTIKKNKGQKGKQQQDEQNPTNESMQIDNEEPKPKEVKTVKKVGKNVVIETDISNKVIKAGVATKRVHVKFGDPEEDIKNKGKNEKDKIEEVVKEENNGEKEEKKKEIKPKSMDSLPVDEKRLFILNLPHSITDEEFIKVFEKYGQVVEAKLPKDADKKPKGYGYITYLSEDAAIAAFAELDNKVVLGRILHIKPAYAPKKLLYQNEEEQKEKEKLQRPEKEKSSYKKKRKRELLERLNDTTNWNTLFLNPNTIIAEMTERLQIKKSDILGEDESNSAVKVALAETQIINETKEWLTTQGLNMEAFNTDRKTCERSKTVIMVKNIPYSVTIEQLYELFSRYGAVYKIHLPPTKAIAVIEFADSDHAQNAFKNLAYYELKDEPLYLEWAPIGLVEEDEEKKVDNETVVDADDAKSRTLFIKNLNFETTESTLKEAFEKEQLGKFTIKIVKRPNKLSSGYGFVEFELEENAQKALKKLQHKIIDGHAIQLSISKPMKKEPKKVNQKRANRFDLEATTKVVVRNVAFEATHKEIRDLFKAFGEVKTVRMPKKVDGQHRGFAFVEFVSVEEAKNAYNALNNTHLYGRKLNLEFGTIENTFEEMTKKIKGE